MERRGIRIYLAQQVGNKTGQYEIYIDGKRTAEYVFPSKIRKFLTQEQWVDFTEGETIFFVDPALFRKRNTDEIHKRNRKIDI